MFKWLLPILLLFSLSGKTQTTPYKVYEPRTLKMPYITPLLVPYVDAYLRDMESLGIDVSNIERFDSILVVPDNCILCESTAAIGCAYGNCVRIKSGWYFGLYQQTYLRLLIYHELGHAILRMPHYEYGFRIMNPYISSIRSYDMFWVALRNDYIGYYFFCLRNEFLLPF